MTLPPWLREALEARFGPVASARPLSGGCVGQALRMEAGGERIFVKFREGAPAGLFRAEADGLSALAACGALRVPAVAAVAADWLALEWLEPAPRRAAFEEDLGRGLAALHRAGGGWGWPAENFIGTLPQGNAPCASWAGFWRDRRLEPQLRLARDLGRQPGRSADWERLFERLPALLAPAEAEGASLLHGDLWSGNVMSTTSGPALVDPAVHRGHREVDLAMAALFGGFGDRFLAAYQEVRPLQPDWPSRRDLYQLYYLLVHVNLFAGGYGDRTAGLLRRLLAA